jgi:hypothetical protein
MVKRCKRRWMGVIAAIALGFTQLAAAAHACALVAPVPVAPVSLVATAEAMSPDCGAMGSDAPAGANVCESHCTFGLQIDTHPEVPAAAIGPRSALIVDAALLTMPAGAYVAVPRAQSSSPPVSLLYSRFQI